MKRLINLFKKKNKRKVDDFVITAGTDIERKYSLSFQKVNDVWCLCVHKCEIMGGLHYTNFSNKTLVVAIHLKGIIDLYDFKKHMLED